MPGEPISAGEAVASVLTKLPSGWWWTVGSCALTCHASIGPDAGNPLCDREHLRFDSFDADLPQPSTPEKALADCLEQAITALHSPEEQEERPADG